MILKIKEALDTIKPDANLINNTELMLRARTLKKRTQIYQKLAIAASLVFLVGAMSLTGYSYYQYPANYLDIDINPSLELDVNRFDRVVNVKYFNEDAENLIDESTLRGCKSEDAVSLVLNAASSGGYIKQDETTVVSLAVFANGAKDTDNTAALLEECTATIENQYSNVAVYSATISSDTKKEADSASISPGKLNLIKMIQTLDKTATVESYKDTSVSNIFNKLTYLTSDENTSVTVENKDTVLNGIKDVTEQIERNKQKLAAAATPSPNAQNDAQSASTPSQQSETGSAAQPQPDSQSNTTHQVVPESTQSSDSTENNQATAAQPSQDNAGNASNESSSGVQPSAQPQNTPNTQEKPIPVNSVPPSIPPTANVNEQANGKSPTASAH